MDERVLSLEFRLTSIERDLGILRTDLDTHLSDDSLTTELATLRTNLQQEARDLETRLRADISSLKPPQSSQKPEPTGFFTPRIRPDVEPPNSDLAGFFSRLRRGSIRGPSLDPPALPHPDTHYRETVCPFNRDSPFDGIIARLTRDHGGNVHDQGIVIITGTSANDGPRNAPKNVADLQTDTWFFSRGEPNQWISYNFRTARVKVTEYSIRSYHGNYHLKSWLIEGSDDGQTWTQIDRRANTNDLNGWDKFRTYGVANVIETRILRLRQTGKSHSGDDYLAFSAWELFGTLLEHGAAPAVVLPE